MELRPARGSERDQVLDLLALWYGDRDFFARYNHHDPGFRDDLCLVACEDGRIVATAQIFARLVNLRGARVPMGGIGSVYTVESHRSRGLGSALMRLAVTTMEREGFEISLLFAERLDFYARFGWRPVTRQFSALADTQTMRTSAGFRLTRFEEARDLQDVAALHRGYSGRFDAAVVRDAAGWRGNLRYAGN
ncbi:MAG: GNAT family N-acetyltransferase, partial [Candidatus Binataceae bacterium]